MHNFYGMAEQIGTVFVECEHGFLHAPNAADIVVRDPATWEVAADGEIGVAQTVSALPESYPGHSILTEDFARVEAVDNCPCGRPARRCPFLGPRPRGRAPRLQRHGAEPRGCGRVTVEQLVPRVGAVEVGELLRGLREAPRRSRRPVPPAADRLQ